MREAQRVFGAGLVLAPRLLCSYRGEGAQGQWEGEVLCCYALLQVARSAAPSRRPDYLPRGPPTGPRKALALLDRVHFDA